MCEYLKKVKVQEDHAAHKRVLVSEYSNVALGVLQGTLGSSPPSYRYPF